jgi:hypothetical protein
MNYFDTRIGRALMDSRLDEAKRASRGQPVALAIVKAIRERLGAWMIARGEKLVSKEPKVA